MMGSGFPSKTFAGVGFALVGFDPIDGNTLRSKLVSGGGVDAGQYSQTCTHLIVDKLVYDDPICVAARTSGKVVVTSSWVDHSFDIGMLIDSNSVLYRPLNDLNGIPGSQSLVVCLTGYQPQDREDIMTMVDMMGGQFSKPLVANQVTHLICYKFEGEKYELAKQMKRIKLVNHRWLEDCLKNWKLLPEVDYALSGYDLELMEASAKDSEDEAEDASVKRANNSPLGLRDGDVAAVFQTNSGAQEGSSFCNTSKENWLTPKKIDRHLEAKVSTDAVASQQYNYHRAIAFQQLRPCSPKENLRPVPSITESGEVGHKSPASGLNTKLLSSNVVPMEDAISTAENISWKCAGDERPERSLTEPMIGNILLQEPRSGSPKQNLADKLDVSDSATRLFNLGGVHMEADIWIKKNMTLKGALDFVPERSVTEPVMRRSSTPPRSGLIGRKEQLETELLKKKSAPRKSLGSRGRKENPINQKGSIYLSERTPKDCLNKGKVSAPVTDKGNHKEISSLALNTEAVPEMAKHTDSETEALKGIDCAEEKDHLVVDLIVNQDKLLVKTSEEPEVNDVPTKDPSDGSLQLEVDKNVSKRKREATVCKSILPSGKRDSSTTAQVGKSRKEHDGKANDTVMKDIGDNSAEEMENLALEDLSGKVVSGGDQSPVVGETLARKEAVTKDPSDAAVQLEVDKNEGKCREEATVEKSGKKGSSWTVEDSEKEDDAKANDTVMKDIGINSGEVKENVAVDKKSGDVSSDGAQSPVAGKPLAREEAAAKDPSSVDKKNKRKHGKEATVETSILQSGKKGSSSTVEVGKSSVKKTKKSKKERGAKATDTVMKHIGDNSAEEKENIAVDNKSGKVGSGRDESPVSRKPLARKEAAKADKTGTKLEKESKQLSSKPMASTKAIQDQEQEPRFFIVSGPRAQRNEYQQIIRRLKGKCCCDSHQWSYEATHFIAPEMRRTEKFFAAAASGSWILKTDYVADSKEAGKLLAEEPYEWHSAGLCTDGAISLEAPRKWRHVREQTGHGALYGMRIVVYGDRHFPCLDTLKRVVKAGDGKILATAPPYTRFLNQNTDFALISYEIPYVDFWIQEFISHEIPCVVSDYIVDYVCKPGYALDKHVLYSTNSWAERSFNKLQLSAEEKLVAEEEEEEAVASPNIDDVACEVCGSRERGEVMLICGDEQGLSGCGIGTHIDCCDPPLTHVPENDWFCYRCNVKPPNKRKKGKC